jgi:hypothetical protein
MRYHRLYQVSVVWHAPFIRKYGTGSTNFTTTFLAHKIIAFSLRDRLLKNEVQKTANGKIQKEQEQTEAQPDGA